MNNNDDTPLPLNELPTLAEVKAEADAIRDGLMPQIEIVLRVLDAYIAEHETDAA